MLQIYRMRKSFEVASAPVKKDDYLVVYDEQNDLERQKVVVARQDGTRVPVELNATTVDYMRGHGLVDRVV